MYEVFLTRKAQDFYQQADPALVRKLNGVSGISGRTRIGIRISNDSKSLSPAIFAIG